MVSGYPVRICTGGFSAGCKGTYASVRPHRHTCGNYWNTVANVDASVSRCRSIGKIIARDLRLVASRLYRMAFTWPRVTCRHYIIPLFRRRPPGLHKPYKRKERKGKHTLNNYATYVLVRIHKSRYRLVPLRATFRRIRRRGKIHLHLTYTKGGKNPCRRHLYLAEIQWSNEVWRREEKRTNRRKECSINHFFSGPEFRNSIDPFPSLLSLGPQFLLISTPKLIRHPTCHPVPHSWFISRRGSYLGVVHISVWFLVGIFRVVELPFMTWHRLDLPLPVPFIAIGDLQSYTSIV